MYKKKKKSWAKHLDFLILDIICLEITFYISYFIRVDKMFRIPSIHEYYNRLAAILLLLNVCIVFFTEAYTGVLRRNRMQELKAVVMHCTTVFAAITVYIWVTKQAEIYSRQVILVFCSLHICGVFCAMSVEDSCAAAHAAWKEVLTAYYCDRRTLC